MYIFCVFILIVGLFKINSLGLLISVCVIKICCCWLLDSFFMFWFKNLFIFIVFIVFFIFCLWEVFIKWNKFNFEVRFVEIILKMVVGKLLLKLFVFCDIYLILFCFLNFFWFFLNKWIVFWDGFCKLSKYLISVDFSDLFGLMRFKKVFFGIEKFIFFNIFILLYWNDKWLILMILGVFICVLLFFFYIFLYKRGYGFYCIFCYLFIFLELLWFSY